LFFFFIYSLVGFRLIVKYLLNLVDSTFCSCFVLTKYVLILRITYKLITQGQDKIILVFTKSDILIYGHRNLKLNAVNNKKYFEYFSDFINFKILMCLKTLDPFIWKTWCCITFTYINFMKHFACFWIFLQVNFSH